jgi:hypothetical protein
MYSPTERGSQAFVYLELVHLPHDAGGFPTGRSSVPFPSLRRLDVAVQFDFLSKL